MSLPTLFTGARAKVFLSRPGQPPQLMGLFDGVDVSYGFGVAESHVLGAFGPRSLDYVDASAVSISATMFRSVRNPVTKNFVFPTVADLLRHEGLEMTILDRQTGEPVRTIRDIRQTTFNESFQARSQVKNTIAMMGVLVDDENTINDPLRKASYVEDGSAVDLSGF